MSRTLRRLLRCAVAALVLLSLSASLATAWLWWQSYSATTFLQWDRPSDGRGLAASRGRVLFWWERRADGGRYAPARRVHTAMRPPLDLSGWQVGSPARQIEFMQDE